MIWLVNMNRGDEWPRCCLAGNALSSDYEYEIRSETSGSEGIEGVQARMAGTPTGTPPPSLRPAGASVADKIFRRPLTPKDRAVTISQYQINDQFDKD